MSYRINYQPIQNRRKRAFIFSRLALLTLLSFSVFLALVYHMWPEANAVIKEALDVARPAVVVSAMDDMAEGFRSGMPVLTVFENTLQRLLQEANFVSG